jgi:hypothetical protein
MLVYFPKFFVLIKAINELYEGGCAMRYMLLIIMSFSMMLGAVSFSGAADVLLLGDDEAETQVQTALQNAGHNVTYGGLYYNWDGVTPNPNNFDVIVALDGEDYGYQFTSTAETALSGFVARGCGLVFTEWTAYDVCSSYKSAAIGQLMPVTSPASGCPYGYTDTWTVLNAAHPLTAGVPANWSDDAGWSEVIAKPGSTVLISGTDSNPLLTFSTVNGGTVIHINHDMTYTTDTINPNALQLILNAVEYSSGCRSRVRAVPTMTEWGMIVFVMLVGFGSIVYLRRQSRA